MEENSSQNNWTRSPIHAHTIKQTNDAQERGLYYNSQYEIENFIQTVGDISGGDPFKTLSDPTYSGFKIFFHFDAHSGLLADEDYPNSALAYLKRIGQGKRYNLLIRFIQTLSKVNSVCPWMFQEITGLKEVYEREWKNPKQEIELEIQTLETIDNKILSLVEMYRTICFDQERWIEILPENLRKFSMSIYVYDFRMFDQRSETARDFLQTLENTDVNKLNHVMFDFGDCEFTTKSGGSYFESVTNNRSESNTNNLHIVSEKCITSSLFRSITGDTALNSAAFEIAQVGQSGIFATEESKKLTDKFIDRLSQTNIFQTVQERKNEVFDLFDEGWKKQLGNLQETVISEGINRAESELTKLYLGNVYGFGFDDLLRLNEDNNFRTAFNSAVTLGSTTQSLKNRQVYSNEIGNINQ